MKNKKKIAAIALTEHTTYFRREISGNSSDFGGAFSGRII